MKFLRFTDKNGTAMYGTVTPDGIRRLSGNFLGEYELTDELYQEKDISFLPPVVPSKIMAAGTNYIDGNEDRIPKVPSLFMKFPYTLIGCSDAIRPHPATANYCFEGELALIIGKPCFNVSESEAADYIFGVTCANDVTAPDLLKKDGHFLRGKNLPTFTPLGPVIETEADRSHLRLQTRVNGKTVQDSTTDRMIFGPTALISYISQFFPLETGDVILTGTPQGGGKMERGDVIEIEIENVGKLYNIMA